MDEFKKKAAWSGFLIAIFALLLVPSSFKLTNENYQTKVLGAQQTINKSQLVSVFIGDHHFTITGYTSPYALVTFDGQGIFDQTYAQVNGYFEISNRFSPLSPREACLSAKDQFGRISAPVCLPPFPVKYDVVMGPIILAPTISLNQDYYYTGDEVILSGQTVPNTDVDFSVFTKDQTNILAKLSPIKPVEAFTFPELNTRSDSKGNFSLSLPSSNTKQFRLFAQTTYDNSRSPASIKLNFKILPIWMIIIQYFSLLIALIRPRLLEIFIIIELVYIVWIAYNYFLHPNQISANRTIVLRKKFELIKT